MKIHSIFTTVLLGTVVVAASNVNGVSARSTRIKNSITSDDEKFWERLLRSGSGDASMAPQPTAPKEPPVSPPVSPPESPPESPPAAAPSTPDSEECDITAQIYCDVRSDDETVGSCSDVIQDPATVSCDSGNPLTSITFIYRGTDPEEVHVTVTDSKDASSSFVVGTNEIFTAEGNFDETVTVVVSTVVDEEAGEALEEGILDTKCEDPSKLVLGEMYGSYLQLVGYGNADGFYTSVYPVRITYVVLNGPVPATVEKAYINSALRLEGPFNAVKNPTDVGKNERLIVYREEQIIDASDKYKTGYTFNFGMNATASTESSCFAEATTSI